MGTSSWQHIPYCIDILMRIQPRQALDVGMGFGRWGMILHEFCDVWCGRVLASDWQVRVTGVEVHEPLISDYHRSFYEEIVVADAADYLRQASGRYDVVIFGDVLEHFGRPVAEELVCRALEISNYVLINIPLGSVWEQGEMYGNPHEEHRSEWSASDFERRPEFVRHKLLRDHVGRPFGTFLLSKDDPGDVKTRLFSEPAALAPEVTPEQSDVVGRLLERAVQQQQHLDLVLSSKIWRISNAIKRTRLYRFYARRRFGTDWEAPYLAMDGFPQPEVEQLGNRPEPAPQPAHIPDALEQALGAFDQLAARNPSYVAFHPRDWLGVSSSTRTLFGENATCLPELRSVDEARAAARAIAEIGAKTIVLSGFGQGWWELSRQLRLAAAADRVMILWHGSFAQMVDPRVDAMFSEMVDVYRRGYVDRLGFVKEGMTDVFKAAGVEACFVKNYIPLCSGEPPKDVGEDSGTPPRGLILASSHYWRKNLFVQIAAANLVPDLRLTVVPGHESLQRFAEGLHLFRIEWRPLVKPDRVCDLISRHDIVLTVTLSECCPMTPMEAMNLGVPCLVGPTSHLFGDPYLDRMLIVNKLDNSRAIADQTKQALDNRAAIIQAYWTWAERYNTEAKASVEEFLSG